MGRQATMMLALGLVLMLLALSSCTGARPAYKDVNYFVGSQGLKIGLTNADTLDEIYESSNFAYGLTIENLGAYSIVGDEQAILNIGFDPFYVQVDENAKGSNYKIDKSNVVVKGLSLIGKSRYYPSGSKIFFYFPYFQTKNITGQRSKPDTQIFASICYPYATTFSALACVDFDVFNENTRSQVCRQQDISAANQGAPVAVTQVEVENLPMDANLVRPVYTVHVSNVGGGTILSPVDNPAEIERVCTNQDLQSSDFNTVRIEATLSNDIKLVCTPNVIRMNYQEGVSRCTVSDEDLSKAIQYRQNYETPLTVNLSYVYLSTLKKDITIKRLNPYGDLSSQSQQGCLDFQVEVGGECVNKCTYCAQNPGDSACNPANSKVETQWNPSFGCRCSAQTCDSLYPSGLCLPFNSYCPAASYCCSNECASSEVRGPDGSCYPKCSTSCATISKPCICLSPEEAAAISGQDSSLFRKEASAAGLYCSKTGYAFEDQAECKNANQALAEQPV